MDIKIAFDRELSDQAQRQNPVREAEEVLAIDRTQVLLLGYLQRKNKRKKNKTVSSIGNRPA